MSGSGVTGWTPTTTPTSTTLSSIATTNVASLESIITGAYHTMSSLGTTAKRPQFIDVSRLIRGAQASLTIISAEQVLATATVESVKSQATQVIWNATENLNSLLWEENIYKIHRLSRVANILFMVLFVILVLYYISMSIKSRYWWFNVAFTCGTLLEFLGYLGRVLSFGDMTKFDYYVLQLVCLTIAPAFIMGGIYFLFGQVIVIHGRQYSYLKPMWYSYIFIACDIVSLVIQAAGGGVSSVASQNFESTTAGTGIMIAGIAFQVLSMSVFLILWTICWWKIYFSEDNHENDTVIDEKNHQEQYYNHDNFGDEKYEQNPQSNQYYNGNNNNFNDLEYQQHQQQPNQYTNGNPNVIVDDSIENNQFAKDGVNNNFIDGNYHEQSQSQYFDTSANNNVNNYPPPQEQYFDNGVNNNSGGTSQPTNFQGSNNHTTVDEKAKVQQQPPNQVYYRPSIFNFIKLILNDKKADSYKKNVLDSRYNPKFESIRRRKLFNYFAFATTAAVIVIYIRCVYRVVELAQGFDGYLITHEVFVMTLDASMCAICCLIFVPFHPQFVFGKDNLIKVKNIKGNDDENNFYDPNQQQGEIGFGKTGNDSSSNDTRIDKSNAKNEKTKTKKFTFLKKSK